MFGPEECMDPTTQHTKRPRPRRSPAKSSARATCRRGVLGLGPNLALAILDVSETGIRLQVREPFEAGEQCEIGLEGITHARPLVLPATVVWCLATADGNYCIGARLQRPLTYRELHTLARL